MATALVPALLGLAPLASAQSASEKASEQRPPTREQPGRTPRFQPPPGGPGRAAAAFERIFTVLTEDQRSSFRDAMEGQRDKVRDLDEKLRDSRKELFESALTGKFDEDAVRKKAMAIARFEAEMTVLRAKAFSQIQPPLTSEQIEKLKNPSPAMEEGRGEPPRPRRRPDVPRDENGLPLKDRSAEPKATPPEPQPK